MPVAKLSSTRSHAAGETQPKADPCCWRVTWEAERLRLFDVLTWQIRCSVVTVVDPSSPRLMAR